MVRDTLLEGDVYSIDEIFEITNFKRNALIVFINAVNVYNYSSDILKYIRDERGIVIMTDPSMDEISRMGYPVVRSDDRSSIDIIGVATRLYEHDTDYEGFVRDIKDIVHSDYDKIFVEFVEGFRYNWLPEEDLHNIHLVY